MRNFNFAIEVDYLLHDIFPEDYLPQTLEFISLSQIERCDFDDFKKKEIQLAKRNGFYLGFEKYKHTEEQKIKFEQYVQSRIHHYANKGSRDALILLSILIVIGVIIHLYIK